MIATALEERNAKLWEKLVPDCGRCDTLEGETLRAINRIIYRYFNDGDYWYEGYGTETAGPAETFLREHSPVNLYQELTASCYAEDEDYEKHLEAMLVKVLDYIESRTEYTPNSKDMLECEPRYTDDEEEDYDDDEDY